MHTIQHIELTYAQINLEQKPDACVFLCTVDDNSLRASVPQWIRTLMWYKSLFMECYLWQALQLQEQAARNTIKSALDPLLQAQPLTWNMHRGIATKKLVCAEAYLFILVVLISIFPCTAF